MDERRHLRLSLVQVAAFVAAGLWLEAMVGLRVQGWMDDGLQREFLRLGHAHGALTGVLNLAIAWAMMRLDTPTSWARPIRVAASLGGWLVGLGFCGGGLWHAPTDPGPIVLVVPAGAMMLLASCLAIAFVRGSAPE